VRFLRPDQSRLNRTIRLAPDLVYKRRGAFGRCMTSPSLLFSPRYTREERSLYTISFFFNDIWAHSLKRDAGAKKSTNDDRIMRCCAVVASASITQDSFLFLTISFFPISLYLSCTYLEAPSLPISLSLAPPGGLRKYICYYYACVHALTIQWFCFVIIFITM
jgi:hypothetical protein